MPCYTTPQKSGNSDFQFTETHFPKPRWLTSTLPHLKQSTPVGKRQLNELMKVQAVQVECMRIIDLVFNEETGREQWLNSVPLFKLKKKSGAHLVWERFSTPKKQNGPKKNVQNLHWLSTFPICTCLTSTPVLRLLNTAGHSFHLAISLADPVSWSSNARRSISSYFFKSHRPTWTSKQNHDAASVWVQSQKQTPLGSLKSLMSRLSQSHFLKI